MKPIVAIDVGSGFTKIACGELVESFRSLAGPAMEAGQSWGVKEEAGFQVRLAGKQYVTGEMAKTEVRQSDLADTRQDDWFKQDGYLALFFSAIGRAFPGGFEGRMRICTGLPVRVFDESREKELRRVLCKKHTFRVNDKHYVVHLRNDDLTVIPQVAGLIVNTLENHPEYMDGKVGVVDIGSFTSDWAVMDQGRMVAESKGGDSIGVWLVVGEIRMFLKETRGIQVNEVQIMQGIERGSMSIRGEDVDLGPVVRRFTLKHAKALSEKLAESWKGHDDAFVLIGGGGSRLLGPSLQSFMPTAELCLDDDEPSFGIVNGYLKYAMALERKKCETN